MSFLSFTGMGSPLGTLVQKVLKLKFGISTDAATTLCAASSKCFLST